MTANKVNKIFITGHSLGAAISTLQAAFLKESLGTQLISRSVVTVFLVWAIWTGRTYLVVWPRSKSTDLAISFSSKYVETVLGVGNQFLHMHVGKDPVPWPSTKHLSSVTHTLLVKF
jgi:hypothetical protein